MAIGGVFVGRVVGFGVRWRRVSGRRPPEEGTGEGRLEPSLLLLRVPGAALFVLVDVPPERV